MFVSANMSSTEHVRWSFDNFGHIDRFVNLIVIIKFALTICFYRNEKKMIKTSMSSAITVISGLFTISTN